MDNLKQQIQQKLIAGVAADKCARSPHLIFRDAWCSQERVLRFTSPFFRTLFDIKENETGKWKTGDCVMYEVQNKAEGLFVRCIMHLPSAMALNREKANALLKACGVSGAQAAPEAELKRWDLPLQNEDINALLECFGGLIDKEIPLFEQMLQKTLAGEPPEETYTEGTAETAHLNKYERNPKARAACIAYHGTACAVCGMDFAKTYGPEFAGKIEVHHIVPLSEIGENYVVDPIKDLVPVCPNCHTALHSKPGGVYTVEELKHIRAKQV